MKKINGFEVNPIGIGTWRMGEGNPEDLEAIRYSISKGQNHIDTAEMYAGGEAEKIVGKAIKGSDRRNLFIASKIWKDNATKDKVVPAVYAMLERLQTDYLDLLYIHNAWPELPMQDYLDGMNDAVDQGLVNALGVSNFSLEQLKQAMELSRNPIKAIQNRFNVVYLDEMPQDLIEYCRKHDIAIVAYRPVERGEVEDNAEVEKIAKMHGATPAQIALQWLVRQDGVHAIPKASNVDHINENIASLDIHLGDGELLHV